MFRFPDFAKKRGSPCFFVLLCNTRWKPKAVFFVQPDSVSKIKSVFYAFRTICFMKFRHKYKEPGKSARKVAIQRKNGIKRVKKSIKCVMEL